VTITEVDGKRRAIDLRHRRCPVEIGADREDVEVEEERRRPRRHHRSYGADTARWFMLSDSPPERDVIWTEAGVEGAHRFVQRVWRLVAEAAPVRAKASPAAATEGAAAAICEGIAHKTLKAVGDDIEKLGFNKAVARLYELSNALQAPLADLACRRRRCRWPALREAVEFLVVDDLRR
jgi:leucyl-tRNA synthetase